MADLSISFQVNNSASCRQPTPARERIYHTINLLRATYLDRHPAGAWCWVYCVDTTRCRSARCYVRAVPGRC